MSLLNGGKKLLFSPVTFLLMPRDIYRGWTIKIAHVIFAPQYAKDILEKEGKRLAEDGLLR